MKNTHVKFFLTHYSICIILQVIQKSFFFYKNILKNKKALQQMPKGWKCLGSPYWTRSELFVGVKL